MVEAFRSLGVETVAGVGTPFDPEFHEAIMREERDDVPDGTVLKEFRRGFRLGSQLLRAAMVQVGLVQSLLLFVVSLKNMSIFPKRRCCCRALEGSSPPKYNH